MSITALIEMKAVPMRASIDFHDETSGTRREVRDVPTNHNLTAE